MERRMLHDYIMVKQMYIYMPENHARRVERISKAKFDRFRAVYHAPPDAYWKGDRIYEALEKWKILSAARTRRLLLPRL